MGESVGENGGDAARSDDGVRGGDPIGLPSFPDQLRISLRSATAVSAPIRIKSSWCEPSDVRVGCAVELEVFCVESLDATRAGRRWSIGGGTRAGVGTGRGRARAPVQ